MQRISFSTTNRDIMVEISKQVDHKDLIEMRQTWQNKSAIIATPLGQQELGAVYINSCVNTSWWVVKLKINIFGTAYIIIVRSDYLKKVKKSIFTWFLYKFGCLVTLGEISEKQNYSPLKKCCVYQMWIAGCPSAEFPQKKISNFFILFLYFPQPKKTIIFRVHLKKTITWPTKYFISFIKKTNFRVSLNE